MKQAQTKGQETMQEQTLQQQHQKAAEHHEQASKHHKEAVKHHESGDNKTAAHHAYLAHGHTVKATEQEMEANKKHKKYAKTQRCSKVIRTIIAPRFGDKLVAVQVQ